MILLAWRCRSGAWRPRSRCTDLGSPARRPIEGNRYVIVGKPFLVQQLGSVSPRTIRNSDRSSSKHSQLIAEGTYQGRLHKWDLRDSAIERAMINGQR